MSAKPGGSREHVLVEIALLFRRVKHEYNWSMSTKHEARLPTNHSDTMVIVKTQVSWKDWVFVNYTNGIFRVSVFRVSREKEPSEV